MNNAEGDYNSSLNLCIQICTVLNSSLNDLLQMQILRRQLNNSPKAWTRKQDSSVRQETIYPEGSGSELRLQEHYIRTMPG